MKDFLQLNIRKKAWLRWALVCTLALFATSALFSPAAFAYSKPTATTALVTTQVTSFSPGTGAVTSFKTLAKQLQQGGSNTPGNTIILANGQNGAEDEFVYKGYVYWYDYGSGQLNRVLESGGTVQTITTVSNPSETAVFGISVLGKYVYWGAGDFSTSTSNLYKTNIRSGKTVSIYSLSGSIYGAVSPWVNSSYVFFISTSSTTHISRIDTNGSNYVALATGPSPFPFSLMYYKGYVYWYDLSYGEVGKVPAAGGSAQILSPQQGNSGSGYNGVRNLDVVGSSVYWSYFNGNSGTAYLFSVSTSGTHFKTLYSQSSDFFGGVSYYKGNVIFAETSNIYSIPKSGGTPTSLATVSAYSVIAQAGWVYFTANSEVGKVTA